MKSIYQVRVDKKDLSRASAVAESLGTSTAEIIRIFLRQVATGGRVPLDLSAQDDLLDVKRRNKVLRELDETEDW